jgi:hypothetical protein
MAKIKEFRRGFFLIPKCISDSPIWFKSSDYLKIWIWLLGNVAEEELEENGIKIKRGQCFTNVQLIDADTRYYPHDHCESTKTIGWSEVGKILEYFEKMSLLKIRKIPTKFGEWILITVIDYDLYQDISNYEITPEERREEEKKIEKDRIRQRWLDALGRRQP